MKNILQKISYAVISSIVTMAVSTFIAIFIPKFIGVEDYGYWQLYLFYISYVGFFQFGWNDGIYLRNGGKKYDELDGHLLQSQFWLLFTSQVILAISMLFMLSHMNLSSDKVFIFKSTAIVLIVHGTRAMLLFLLQATNRVKEFSLLTMFDRILFLILVILSIGIGIYDYKVLVLADIVAKTLSLIYAMILCRNIVFKAFKKFHFSFLEVMENIGVGIKIMLANISSLLIIGNVRFAIERLWGVETFGQVSFTLSIASIFMIFINSVSLVIFPLLRRVDTSSLTEIYKRLRIILMPVLCGLLFLYFPLKLFLLEWLPHYEESIKYMALIFPIIIYEGKTSLLVNTYLKVLRKEKMLLFANVISLGLSFILTFVVAFLFGNLIITILLIVVLVAFKSILAEILLNKSMGLRIYKDIFLELAMTIIFIYSTWSLETLEAFVLYGLAYGIYLLVKINDLKMIVKIIHDFRSIKA